MSAMSLDWLSKPLTERERRWIDDEMEQAVRNACYKTMFWYGLSTLKSGKPGRRVITFSAPFSPIYVCEFCGFRSGSRRVQLRDTWTREHPSAELCMACWNRVRPHVKRMREADECRRLVNRYIRKIRDERKHALQHG